MAIDLLLILPATHAFCEMFLKLCANLGSHFCDMEYVMILGKRKSFINIILSYDHTFRYYCSQVVAENDPRQKHGLEIFAAVEKHCSHSTTAIWVSSPTPVF